MVNYLELSKKLANERKRKQEQEYIKRKNAEREIRKLLQECHNTLKSGMKQWDGIDNFTFVEPVAFSFEKTECLNNDNPEWNHQEAVYQLKVNCIAIVEVKFNWWEACNKICITVKRCYERQGKLLSKPEEVLLEVAAIASDYM